MCSYIFLFGVSFIHSKELSKSHPNTVKSKISKKQSVLVRLEKKRKENRANAKLKPKHAAEIKKLILKPTRASFTKDPIHWYKSYFMGIYKASLGMVQYNLYAMFFMVLLVLIYTVYLLSSKIPLIACTYAFFAFLLLPALFHVNYQFFLHNAVKYQIVNISLFAMIFLLSYIKLNRFRV